MELLERRQGVVEETELVGESIQGQSECVGTTIG